MRTEFVYSQKVDVCGNLSGIVTVPADFDPKKESLPVIVFLHGAGERGTDLEVVKVNGIPKLFSRDPEHLGFRVITLSPQCPEGMVWLSLIYPLKSWIEGVVAELNGDPNRISLTGLSMGGFGTWAMITTFPDYFSCAAPICGGGMSWNCGGLKDVKIRAFHGIDDQTVPFIYSQLMVEAARNVGADVELIAYDKVGHDSWTRAYEQTDLIEWLIAQSK